MLRHGILVFSAIALVGSASFGQSPTVEANRQKADEAYQARQYMRTVEYADAVLAESPEDHVALYLRGSARIELGVSTGNPDAVRLGIADAREAIRHEGTGLPDYYLPYIFGMSYLTGMEGKVNHAQTARQVADSVLEREDLADEERANLLYQRANAEVQLKNYPAAEADLRQAIQLSPKHSAAYMLQADITASTKSPAEGLAAYSQVITVFPKDAVAYNNRGMFLLNNNQAQQALSDFTVAAQLDPRFTEAHVNRGFCLIASGDYATAEQALNQALLVDEKHTGALGLRGNCRLNLGRTAEGIMDYRQVVQLAPTSATPYTELGFAQFFAGDYAGANGSFAKAMEIDPEARFLLPWRLAAEVRNGSITQELYRETLTRAEGQRDWVDSLILYQGGRIDEAGLLAAIHPTDVEAREAQICEGYYFMGLEMTRRNRPAEARGYFERALQRTTQARLSAFRGAQLALKTASAAN
ncbi:MAG: tetratricopeptide repeat protein [Planctomycetaceae bacterium]|nr:tetratricopeptide repeat protein [Planctomycetaceae bacterium]MCA9042748.1 tetratricopeptide repeat protein [Planctomycetaceae bacterium]